MASNNMDILFSLTIFAGHNTDAPYPSGVHAAPRERSRVGLMCHSAGGYCIVSRVQVGVRRLYDGWWSAAIRPIDPREMGI
jgi:hypothetical protein